MSLRQSLLPEITLDEIWEIFNCTYIKITANEWIVCQKISISVLVFALLRT